VSIQVVPHPISANNFCSPTCTVADSVDLHQFGQDRSRHRSYVASYLVDVYNDVEAKEVKEGQQFTFGAHTNCQSSEVDKDVCSTRTCISVRPCSKNRTIKPD